MIDWTKPIELMDGTPVVLDPDGWAGGNPDYDGDYWIKRPDGERIPASSGGRGYASMCCNPDGSEEGTAIQIVRNRAEPANDELTELRAFKEAAIARFPELAPVEVDSDILQARKIALKFALPAQFSRMTSHRTNQGEFDDSDVMAAIGEAMDWARANPR